jgi:hypothetical protein
MKKEQNRDRKNKKVTKNRRRRREVGEREGEQT